MILADTSVWLQYYRTPSTPVGQEFKRVMEQGEIAVTGPVVAELVQGARSPEEFSLLKERLARLPYLETGREEWLKAGELSRALRRQAITIPLADLMIAIVAMTNDLPLFALDKHFQRVPGLRLHTPEQAG